MSCSLQAHWQDVYISGEETKRGWYQEELGADAKFVARNYASAQRGFVDIGAGVSNLASFVIRTITHDVTVIDISKNAIEDSRKKLCDVKGAERANFICTNVLEWTADRKYGFWHDRAMFHFLRDEREQIAYVERLNAALIEGGKFALSGFAPDGPERCSGLEVSRLSLSYIQGLLGEGFVLEDQVFDIHYTPKGHSQKYAHFLFMKHK